jgi:4-amino-4-deoxychorismate lyase
MDGSLWLVNGEKSLIHPSDRGLSYGDGLFETMAAHAGDVRWLDRHLSRLRSSAARLEIECPADEILEHEIRSLCPARGSAAVRLTLTRGPGARGYSPPDRANTTRIVSVSPWPDYPDSHYSEGVDVVVLDTRLGENPALAGMKHLCRLEQVLGRREVDQIGATEGIMLDQHGAVVGGTMSNVFLVSSGVLTTPVLDRCGVRGVMRGIVMEHADGNGIQVAEERLTVRDLEFADEIFLTNSLFGIWPVSRCDSRRLAPGPLSLQLIEQIGVVPHAS